MKKARLAAAAVLFAVWIGWLAYLAFTGHDPIVLARPQFLVADLWVVAELKGDDHPLPQVTLSKIVWARDDRDRDKKQLTVTGLDLIKKYWHGQGKYILALTRTADEKDKKVFHYKVTPLPVSGGTLGSERIIYPAETLDQLEDLKRRWK